MNYAKSQTNILRIWNQAPVFYMMAMFTFAALLMYVLFIGRTIFTLVESKQIENENRVLGTEISELELQTLALNDSISIEKAYAMGFVSARTAEYVAPALVLTQR